MQKNKEVVIPQAHVLDMFLEISPQITFNHCTDINGQECIFKVQTIKKYNYIITILILQTIYLPMTLLYQHLLGVKLLSVHEMDPENNYMYVFNNTEHNNISVALDIYMCTYFI